MTAGDNQAINIDRLGKRKIRTRRPTKGIDKPLVYFFSSVAPFWLSESTILMNLNQSRVTGCSVRSVDLPVFVMAITEAGVLYETRFAYEKFGLSHILQRTSEIK